MNKELTAYFEGTTLNSHAHARDSLVGKVEESYSRRLKQVKLREKVRFNTCYSELEGKKIFFKNDVRA